MNRKISYKRNVSSAAMSKSPYQSGLFLMHEKRTDTIKIHAINPRTNDVTTHLHLSIPVEELDSVIGALVELKKELK